MNRINYIVVLILITCAMAQAQFTKNIEVVSYYDDNLYRSPDPTQDLLTDIGIHLNYRPDDSDMNYYYSGSFFLYQNNPLRNFSLHGIGFSYSNPFGKDEQNNFYLGSEWSRRFNGEEYNYYDYNQLYASTNFRFDLDFMFLKSGYNFRYRNYSILSDLTNYRHYLFVQANKSFETRTSLILEVDLGYKSFAGQEIFTSSGGGRGNGRMAESHTTTTTSEIPSMGQAIFLARIAQSLFEKVGIYAQYRKQMSLTESTTYKNLDSYYQDEELFDDPFSYESESVSSQLTWMLPWSMKLQIGGSIISKNYISEQAFSSAEDTLGLGGIRLDDRSSYYLNFSKTFYLNKNWLNSLQFNINYSYIRNESNSYWYDYKNAVFGGGIQWKF